jgi:hypothetical protein
MLGQEVAYDEIPYIFSDQYETGMEYGGYASEWDEVFRGDAAPKQRSISSSCATRTPRSRSS